jgi:hypothetical protein
VDRTTGLKVCPHCGQIIPPKIRVGGKRRQAMYDYIAVHPEGVTVWQVLEHVYADDPNGGPDKHNVIAVVAKQINNIIKPFGLRIKGSGGPGSRYTLQQI